MPIYVRQSALCPAPLLFREIALTKPAVEAAHAAGDGSKDVRQVGQRQLTRLTVGWTVGPRLSGSQAVPRRSEANSGDTQG